MPAPEIVVTLPADYLARNVVLRVGRDPGHPRRWELQASDGNGFYSVDIRIDGVQAPEFRRKRDALAFLAALGDVGTIWATPRERSQGRLLPSLGGASGWRGQHAEQGAF